MRPFDRPRRHPGPPPRRAGSRWRTRNWPDGLWHRAGAGPVTLAHRLAAATIYALLYEDSRDWRLSPVIRDIIALGDSVVPDSIDALDTATRQVVDGAPFRPLVESLAGDLGTAERRFRDVVGLASGIAREVAAAL